MVGTGRFLLRPKSAERATRVVTMTVFWSDFAAVSPLTGEREAGSRRTDTQHALLLMLPVNHRQAVLLIFLFGERQIVRSFFPPLLGASEG